MVLPKMSLQHLSMEGTGAATDFRFLLALLPWSTLSPVITNSAIVSLFVLILFVGFLALLALNYEYLFALLSLSLQVLGSGVCGDGR